MFKNESGWSCDRSNEELDIASGYCWKRWI